MSATPTQLNAELNADNFPVWPVEVDAYVSKWQAEAAGLMRVESLACPAGDQILAVTISRFGSSKNKTGVYISQPHAHEPATIAGMVQVMNELLTGVDLDGQPTTLDVDRILSELTLTFNPIGNPHGRLQSDVRCWDGSRMDNRSFILQAFGIAPAEPDAPAALPRMWPRLNEWQMPAGDHGPNPIGFVYEPVGDGLFVEPNRSERSSFMKLFRQMAARYNYHYWLDLHQTEFEGRDIDCEIWQSCRDMLTPAQLGQTDQWAQQIIDGWTSEHFRSAPSVHASATSEPMKTYFRNMWLPLQQRMHLLVAEVRNNCTDFQGIAQRDAVSTAIRQTLTFACEHPVSTQLHSQTHS